MLYVVMTSDRRAGEKETRIWHMGDNTPLSHEDMEKVVEIQADCDELIWVAESFKNLPIHNRARVQRWFGDQAKFIASVLGR